MSKQELARVCIQRIIEQNGFVQEGDCWKARSITIRIVDEKSGFRVESKLVEEYDHGFPRLSYTLCECGTEFLFKNRGVKITEADFFTKLDQLTKLRVYYSRFENDRLIHGEMFFHINCSDQEIRQAKALNNSENVYYFDGKEDVCLVPPVDRYGLHAD